MLTLLQQNDPACAMISRSRVHGSRQRGQVLERTALVVALYLYAQWKEQWLTSWG